MLQMAVKMSQLSSAQTVTAGEGAVTITFILQPESIKYGS